MVDSKELGLIVTIAIFLIVGSILSGVVGNEIKGTEDTESAINESIDISSIASTTVNETITLADSRGFVTKGPVTSVSFFGNATDNTNLEEINTSLSVNFSKDGEIFTATENFTRGLYNITYTSTTDSTGTTANDDLISINGFSNATIGLEIDGIDISDEINLSGADENIITVSGYNFSDGDYNISYGYEGDSFVSNSTARSFLRLVPLFFVMFILIVAIMLSMKFFPDMLG